MNWVTIPSGSDPWNASNLLYNAGQDALTEGGSRDHVIAIDILREGDLANNFDGQAILVLCQRTVRVFRFANATSTWTTLANSVVSDASGVDRPKTKKRDPDVPNPFVTYLPRKANSAWTDIAVHRNATAGQETFYVTTTGAVKVKDDGSLEGDANYDTCWWYNGNGRWYPTGLRNAPLDAAAGSGGSPAAAHSVVVDPVDPRTVYVGNRIGVWEGRIDESGAHPAWSWKPAMEGLPQALVEDLHVFHSADGAYLRAALVSRGMWERDVSALPVSVGRTFIRALSWDTGRAELPAAPTDPVSNAALDYHSSPDILVLPQGPRPWDPGMPNEADLLSAVPPAIVARAVHDAWIMVHHRHTHARAGRERGHQRVPPARRARGLHQRHRRGRAVAAGDPRHCGRQRGDVSGGAVACRRVPPGRAGRRRDAAGGEGARRPQLRHRGGGSGRLRGGDRRGDLARQQPARARSRA